MLSNTSERKCWATLQRGKADLYYLQFGAEVRLIISKSWVWMESVSLWKISRALVALSSLWLIYSVWFILLNCRWPAWNQARADKWRKAVWNCRSKGFLFHIFHSNSLSLFAFSMNFHEPANVKQKLQQKNRLYIVTYRVQFGKFAKTSTLSCLKTF